MDGDVAPLAELLELARRHGARLMVDEAHATGALGPGGRGSVAAAGLSGEVDVVVGTLGKALGSYGAYVCAGAETVDFLVNSARPFVFSTAPPPRRGRRRRGRARPARGRARAGSSGCSANAATLRAGLAAEGAPVPEGDRPDRAGHRRRGRARRWRSASGCSRPASSPRESARRRSLQGSSRLRFTVMATHRPEELREAARLAGAAARELGLTSAPAAGSLA